MSEEIEFDDVVDFDSEEEEKEELTVPKTKEPTKNCEQNGTGLNDKKPEKESFVKEIQKFTTNDYLSKPATEEKSVKKEILEKPVETTERVKKSLTDSLSLLTDDDEINKILNTKYDGRTGGFERSRQVNGFDKSNSGDKLDEDIDDIEAYIEKIKLEDKPEINKCELINDEHKTEDKLLNHFDESEESQKEISHPEESNFPVHFTETSKFKSSSPVDFEKKEARDSMAGRIEMTRNYLKALTPDEGLKGSGEKDASEIKESAKNAFFEIGKRSEDAADVVEEVLKDPISDTTHDVDDTMNDVDEILKNDESTQLKRRQSMDDFIQKILAEAREDKNNDSENEISSIIPKEEEEKEDIVIETNVTEKRENDIMKETDILLENILTPKKSIRAKDAELDEKEEGNDGFGKYFSKNHEKSDTNKDIFQNGKENGIGLSTKRNRHRIGVKERDEAEDEIEKIVSSKKYEPSSKPPRNKSKKLSEQELLDGLEDNNYVNGDANDDFRDFLNKFKKDRQTLFGKEINLDRDSHRSAETQEYVKDKTQTIRAVINQQSNISENVKSVSKQLDDLDKELREVRQTTLERKSRLEALENAVNAERKQYEVEHNSAVERNRNKKPIEKYTQEIKNQITASILNKKQPRYSKFSEDQDDLLSLLSSSKRRAGSVCSVASLMEENDNFLSSNSFHPSNDLHKYRSISKDRDFLGAWNFDRKEGNISRDGQTRSSFAERNNFEDLLSGGSDILSQIRPRSRASIATMDLSNSTADDFLNKIRSKYSFLSSKDTSNDSSHGMESGRGGVLERMSYSGIKHMNNPTPQYKPNLTNLTNGTSAASESLIKNYDVGQARRANSVSDNRSSIHYDKSIGGYTAFPSRNHHTTTSDYVSRPLTNTNHSSVRSNISRGGDSKYNSSNGGGEFKSRFLNKVRERKACAIEHTPGTSQLADRVMAKLSTQKDASSPAREEREVPMVNGD